MDPFTGKDKPADNTVPFNDNQILVEQALQFHRQLVKYAKQFENASDVDDQMDTLNKLLLDYFEANLPATTKHDEKDV